MKKLQLFGSAIIILIVTAFITTPEFFRFMNVPTTVLVIAIIIALLYILVATIGRLTKTLLVSHVSQIVTALVLFLCASSLFVFIPEYFTTGVSLPMSFWHRVSFYTLPAIAFESGVITMFRLVVLPSEKFSASEKQYLQTAVLVYAACVMIINFMTILDLLAVQKHMIISRGIIAVFVIMAIIVCERNIKARSR